MEGDPTCEPFMKDLHQLADSLYNGYTNRK